MRGKKPFHIFDEPGFDLGLLVNLEHPQTWAAVIAIAFALVLIGWAVGRSGGPTSGR